MKVTSETLLEKVIAKLSVTGMPEFTGQHESIGLLVDGKFIGASVPPVEDEDDDTVIAFTVDNGGFEVDENSVYIPAAVIAQLDPDAAKTLVVGLRYCGIHKHWRHITESGRARCMDCTETKTTRRAAVRQEKAAKKILDLIDRLGIGEDEEAESVTPSN
jgi:hypothetical protein